MKRSNVVVELTGNEVTKVESGLEKETSVNVVYRNEDASIKDVKYMEASGNDYESILKRHVERGDVVACDVCESGLGSPDCVECDKPKTISADDVDFNLGVGEYSDRGREMKKYIIEQRKGGVNNE